MADITLTLLTDDDREQFILDNQRAFRYGAMEEFGVRDNHCEEDGEIISRRTIENCIDSGTAYRIRENGRQSALPDVKRNGLSVSSSDPKYRDP